jgi:hypothetical protein
MLPKFDLIFANKERIASNAPAISLYTKLIESSDALAKKIDDSLIPIDIDSNDIKIVTPSENGSVNLSNGHFDANIDD